MSIRELQQGAWRMRGLAKGQGCEMLLPEEVALYMRVLLKDDRALNLKNLTSTEALAEALRDIQSALLLKSLEQEELQARQLVRQDLLSAWKDEALGKLLQGRKDQKDDSGGNGINALLEFVPTSIRSSSSQSLEDALRDLAQPFNKTLSVRAAVDQAVKRAVQMLGTSSASDSCTGEIVREQEEQQQHEHQIESEENGPIHRPRIGETRFWELEKLQILASNSSSDKGFGSLFAFPTFASVAEILMGIAGAASNVAKKNSVLEMLATVGLRFSPNSRLTTEIPIVRPVLVALQLEQAGRHCVVALSLSEAESLRWALEYFGASSRSEALSFSLHVVSESPMFGADAVRSKVICSSDVHGELSQLPICLLRFYLGESWFSTHELNCLQSTIGQHKQDFRRLRAAVFSARRPGGAADWSCTPLATVLGEGASITVAMQPPGPTFLERYGTEALAGGKDFVETYANHVNDFEAVVEE